MITPGLSRITALLEPISLPWTALHVAGTNGKGSVCAGISALLEVYNSSRLRRATAHAPLRHGRFTTPHLRVRHDSIAVNGVTVSESAFLAAEKKVLARDAAGHVGASEFELLTATAFEVFTDLEVDVGVVEVGMGGKEDATNVLGWKGKATPLVTGITDIGMDHTEFLGDTLEAIAEQKAGIIKQGVPVVAAKQKQEVEAVIASKAKSMGVQDLSFVSSATTLRDLWQQNRDGSDELGEAGQQVIQSRWANGAVALQMTWKALTRLGRLDQVPVALRAEMMRDFGDTIHKVVWHGRLETINVRSIVGFEFDVVLDGAHNADSARMLRKHLDGTDAEQATTWIVASSSSKKIREILKILLREGDTVQASTFGPVDGMPWIKPVESQAILEAASNAIDSDPQTHAAANENLSETLKRVCTEAKQSNRRVVITGSLYIISEFYRLLDQQ